MITTVGTSVGSRLAHTNVLVGIDDTDNLDSPGTGRLARMLVDELGQLGLGRALGATRHQLLVDPRIPYTSHNSSVCVALDAGAGPDAGAITRAAAEFLERMGAEGSDPGLAVACSADWQRGNVRERLALFGLLAKQDVLNQAAARALADDLGIHLSPHGGDGGGIIGALAAVGLHCGGADGRFLWMPGMREVSGTKTYGELLAAVPIDAALDPSGAEPAPDDPIDLGEWVRPILRDGRAVLLLDPPLPESSDGQTRWVASTKEAVKSY
jgi:hypothetical protein